MKQVKEKDRKTIWHDIIDILFVVLVQMSHKDDCNVLRVHMILVSSSVLCQSRHGEIPDSSLQSTGSSRSSHSRSPSLHHMHEEDRPVPRRSHSHGYPHGHGHRGRLRSVRFALTSAQPHMLFLVITQLSF